MTTLLGAATLVRCFSSLLDSMTLREKLDREKRCGGGEAGGKAANVKSVLRMQHLWNLALWVGTEASMPSYAPLLGNHLATCAETSGVPLSQSLFPCQRCESILLPGSNCTVRVESNGTKARRRYSRFYVPTKNAVIYTCHFCSHRNLKRGTPKSCMKERFISKGKSVPDLESNSTIQKSVSSKRKHNIVLKEQVATESITGKASAEKVVGESSRKRRKTWSSLKEIAENKHRSQI